MKRYTHDKCLKDMGQNLTTSKTEHPKVAQVHCLKSKLE